MFQPSTVNRKQATLNFASDSDKKSGSVTGYQLWKHLEKDAWMVGGCGSENSSLYTEKSKFYQLKMIVYAKLKNYMFLLNYKCL